MPSGPETIRVFRLQDGRYITNYGGLLIGRDRLPGTFEPETHRPTEDLTNPMGAHNLPSRQYRECSNIIRDAREANNVRGRLGYIFAPPGWLPEPLRE